MYSELLDRIEAYLEQREDVRDGSDRTPLPNEAMDLLMRLREARRETPRHSTPRPEAGEWNDAIEASAKVCETAPDLLQNSTFSGAAAAIRALKRHVPQSGDA